ncbi:hypothetical protein [Nitrobacter sp.]|uniref:hypothetical protein n=1 Tax=Nitrobacter sp. TaxID=29420 RepID=UPI0032208831
MIERLDPGEPMVGPGWMRQNKITDALNSGRRQRTIIAGGFNNGAQRDDDMALAMIEKHPAERLTGLRPQRTGGLVTLNNRYPEIGAYPLYCAHAASCHRATLGAGSLLPGPGRTSSSEQ